MIAPTSLVDTFSFNGEPVVALRLEYLYPHVDRFFIVESWITHSGNRKPFLYKDKCAEWFEPYKDKIEWIILEDFPPMCKEWKEEHPHDWMRDNHEHWYRESFQRNASQPIIQQMYKDKRYMLFVCDADEIPNVMHWNQEERTKIYEKVNDPVYLSMIFFHYNFKWVYPYLWENRAYVIKDTDLQKDFNYYRITHPYTKECKRINLREGGWHLSYFMNAQDIKRKLQSIAHREVDKQLSEKELMDFINNGTNLAVLGGGAVVNFQPTPQELLQKLPFAPSLSQKFNNK